MLDFVIGAKTKPGAADDSMRTLRSLNLDDGILYIGYPVVATETETTTIDALFTSARFGVVVFDLVEHAPSPDEWRALEEREDQMVAGLTSRLLLYKI